MSRRVIAAATVGALGLVMAVALMPFALGLLGAPVLAVTFGPLNGWLRRRTSPRVAASLVVLLAFLAIMIPAVAMTMLIVSELPSVLSGPGMDRVLAAVRALRIGPFDIGGEMAAISGSLATWISRQAIDLFGGATFMAINLLIAFFGLFYLLLSRGAAWRRIAGYLPFNTATTERLRSRFHDVTRATILGIGATAVLQASIIGLSFYLVGLSHPVLWGAVTGIVSVLPVLGSAIVWLPGVIVLFADQRPGAGLALAAIGFIVASNVDNVVRPIIFKRVSHIHPLLAVVGAFAGMRYFGLLGVLLGPLALVYFIELLRAYEAEYGAQAPEMNDGSVEKIRATSPDRPDSSDPTDPRVPFSPPGAERRDSRIRRIE